MYIIHDQERSLIEITYWGVTLTVIWPPKMKEVRRIIDEFEGTKTEKKDMGEELILLWHLVRQRSRGKLLRSLPAFYEDWDVYFVLKRKYPEATKVMWQYKTKQREERKRQWQLNTPDAEKKYLKIDIPSIENLEHIRKVRGYEFFNKEPVLCKVDHNYRNQEYKKRVETELETLWYIVLHIGPKRRVQKSLNPDSVDYLIYKSLKRKYDIRHSQMVDYIKSHPEIYTEPNETS